jgi:CDP-diacylglycerol--glycerol-3-phosphate 3-phosphatidyltransferase
VTTSAAIASPENSPGRPARQVTFLGGTALSVLKPRFRHALRPLVAQLARLGVTANQVTLLSLLGSLLVGGALSVSADRPLILALLPLWLLLRMCCATIDGSLAIDFGQKSRLGGVLNEVGDLISDAALLAPLAFTGWFTRDWVVAMIVLAALTEIAGILGPWLGGSRRLDGPLGKADRSIMLGIAGAWLATGLPLPGGDALPAICAVFLLLTVANRLRAAAAERPGAVSPLQGAS